MMSSQEEGEEKKKFTAEDLRYLKVAIALAVGSDGIGEMPKTNEALHVLYDKIERIYKTEVNKDQ